MNPEPGSIDHISQVISQVVAPSFMLGAVAACISMLFSRMDVVIERIRTLNAIADDDIARLPLRKAIPVLQARIRMMHQAILLAICSGIATTLLIIAAFAMALFHLPHVWVSAGLFIIALAFFCASLVILAMGVWASISDIDEH